MPYTPSTDHHNTPAQPQTAQTSSHNAATSRCRGASAAGFHRPVPSGPPKPLEHAGPRRSSLPAGVHPRGASRRQQQRASPTSPTRWRLAYRLCQLVRSFTSRCSSSRSRFAGSPPELRDARPPPPASSGAFGPRDQQLPRAVAARAPAACRRSGRQIAQQAAGKPPRLCLGVAGRAHSRKEIGCTRGALGALRSMDRPSRRP